MVLRIEQGISERAVFLFRFERGSERIAVAAVGEWKSGLMAISKGGGRRVKAAISTADIDDQVRLLAPRWRT